MAQPRWLTAQEQVSWRAFLAASLLLQDQFGRDLQRTHGLTMADYEILVRLSDAEGHRLRMSDLAEVSLSSKSRITHQITRMEEAGLVERQPCATDKRSFFAVLTDAGWQRLVDAAPDHVASVRKHLVDVLTPEQFAELGRICLILVEHIQGRDEPARL